MPGHQVGYAVLRGKGSIGGLDRKKNLPIFRILSHALAAKPFPLTVLPIGQLDAVGLFTEKTKLQLFLACMHNTGEGKEGEGRIFSLTGFNWKK